MSWSALYALRFTLYVLHLTLYVTMDIPFLDLKAQYATLKPELDAVVADVLASGWYILGEQVAAFEQEFAACCGVAHGVGVGSGTAALQLALLACGVGPGDEVITVSHTAVATVAAIELTGATPVLVDIEPATFTLDPQRLEAAITARTRVVIPVHLYGQPADLQPIQDIARGHGLRVIEDCAQAHGAMYRGRRVGGWGDLACFSFYPTKNLGAAGDGGMVVTDDVQMAERVQWLRQYGWRRRYVSEIPGLNSRLDELQAAILRVKLSYLDAWNARRRALAARYDALLAGGGVVTPAVREGCQHVYHLYVVRSQRRDALQVHLKQQGIASLVHYPLAVHQQPAYADVTIGPGGLPETERAAAQVLSLPLYPEMPDEHVGQVAAAVRAFDR